MAFSPARDAFEGFRVLGRNPAAFLAWTAFMLVVWTLIGGLAWLLVGQDILAFIQAGAESRDPWQGVVAMLPKLIVVQLVLMVAGVLSYAVLLNAIARAVLKPEESASWYMRFGGDEWRAAVVYVVLYLGVVALFGLSAISVIAAFGTTENWGAAFLAGLLALCVVTPVLIWVGLRLSLVLARVVATGRIDFAGAWRLTRGHFWPLFGMAVLNFIVIYAMQIVIQLVTGPLMLPITMSMNGVGDAGGLAAILNRHWPLLVGLGVLLTVAGMAQLVIQYAPFAAAHRDIAGPSGDPEAFPASEFS